MSVPLKDIVFFLLLLLRYKTDIGVVKKYYFLKSVLAKMTALATTGSKLTTWKD